MKSYKRRIESKLLQRMAHADCFEVGHDPQRLLVFLGGTGQDEESYVQRSHSIIPIFDRVLSSIEDQSLAMVYVTAPYDIPFVHFERNQDARMIWNNHLIGEVLAPWASLPFHIASFSGSTHLAFNGVHLDDRCVGAAAIAPDGFPRGFAASPAWAQPLSVYCGAGDRVCGHPDTMRQMERLEAEGHAEIVPLPRCSHRLVDYATPACLGEFIRSRVLTHVEKNGG